MPPGNKTVPKTNAVLPGFWANVGLAVVFFLLTLTARPTRRRLAWRGLIAAFLLLGAVSVLGLALNYDPTRPPAVGVGSALLIGGALGGHSLRPGQAW